MARARRSALSLSLLACGLLAVLAGCGDEPAASSPPPADSEAEAGWSDHAGGTEPETAEGTPDGPEARTPAALLARLHRRVVDGRGLGDATYERDVRDAAEVIWPADGSAAERAGAQVHMQLAAVAAEVSGWLAAGEEVRAARAESNPVDLEIHAAFVAAAAGGPEAYRAWCETAGAALLKKLAEARRARFFPPR